MTDNTEPSLDEQIHKAILRVGSFTTDEQAEIDIAELKALISDQVAEARIAQIETIVQRLNDLDDPNQHVSDTAMEIVMFDLHELKADKE